MRHFSRYKVFFVFASVLFEVLEVFMLCHYKLYHSVYREVYIIGVFPSYYEIIDSKLDLAILVDTGRVSPPLVEAQ